MIIGVFGTGKPSMSKEMKDAIEKAAQAAWGIKEEKPMKYFQMTAYTPFCGEELTSYEMAENEEELYTSGKADALIDDCISSYMEPSDYEDYGFESEEEWDEYYREGSGVEIIEITKQSYEDYKESGY